ncbi:MAG: SIMPL domain-containing protein [Candidatus Planktophila sp.]|jgi:hypothetical protein
MSINNPQSAIERTKAITLIVVAVIMAIAVGGGLVKVGAGFASRTNSGITVTGSSKTEAVADNVVWTLNASQTSANVADAVRKVGADVDALTNYLTKGGVPADALTLGPVSTYGNQEYSNGNYTGRILNYVANRDLTVRSKDVELISRLSQGIGALLQTGVSVNNYGPAYYVSTLPDLRPQLLAEAMKDAQVRAKAITDAVGGGVGAVLSVKSGVIQVTTPDSTMTTDVGAYDTSTIQKTVTATVSVTFKTE